MPLISYCRLVGDTYSLMQVCVYLDGAWLTDLF